MRQCSLAVVMLLGGMWLFVRPLHAQLFTPTFAPAPCMFELTSEPLPEERGVRCGYVTVLERHDVPNGRTIELAVVVIPPSAEAELPTSTTVAPDPLFVAQGGPGGSTIDFFAPSVLEHGDFANLGRDIVLIEQRGTYYSKPNLSCVDEEIALLDQTLEMDLSDDDYEERALASEQTCRDRLIADGVDITAYNSLENAADMDDVRQALGYEQINFYGVSYGTLLALHLMREYPEHVRTVILDAVVPTQTPFLAETARSADRAFDELFATCAADRECAAAFPNLETRFYNLVTELNDNPASITLTDDETGRTYHTSYTGDDLISTLFGNLYVSSILNSLPLIITQIEQGDFSYVELDLSFRIFDRTFSSGMYSTVICAEDYDMPQDISSTPDINPLVYSNKQESLDSFLKSCQLWDVPPLDVVVNQPVNSDIPTLVLSGQFDPITPPEFAAAAAQTLTHSYVYTVPAVGHGAATDSDCAAQLIHSFLAAPDSAPNSSCLAAVPPLDFVTPDEFLRTDVAWQLNSALTDIGEGVPISTALLQPLIACGSLLIMLTIFFFWPLSYLAEKMRDEMIPKRTPWVRIAGWLTALNTLIMIVFTVGVVWAIFYTYFEIPDIALFGVTPAARPLFVLPYLILLLMIPMIIGLVSAWQTGAWSITRRIYYTLLTAVAVVFVVVMGVLGFYTVLL